ncbi:MAG: pyrroline-5-carboxylate reductase [Phycisphaerales bacterium JB054]
MQTQTNTPHAAPSVPLARPLLVIGGGNMGGAIVTGAVRARVLAGERVVIVDPNPEKHTPFEALGIGCVSSIPEGLEAFAALEAAAGAATEGLVMLAVKPQMLGAVAAELAESLRQSPRPVLSILAGITTARLAAEVGGQPIRLMPNTPAQIGKGLTALCVEPNSAAASPATPSAEDIAATRRLFESVGRVVELPESLLDAFTGVAGSGPAYVFLLAEGMLAGAEAVGFDHETGLELVRATIAGAAGLLEAAAETEPAALRAMVTSKGGTTAAATDVLAEHRMPFALREAIVAARDRGRALSQG